MRHRVIPSYGGPHRWPRDHISWKAALRFVIATLAAVSFGAVALFQAFLALADGQLQVPRKYSSSPVVVVSPTVAAPIYYALLLIYVAVGVASVALAVSAVWRLWRATPAQRSVILAPLAPSLRRQPVRLLRSLLLFVAVPFVALVIIVFYTISKS
jgi:hypothetical protein